MVLLNIDLGELPDEPPELAQIAHIANVACGGHAGDLGSMRVVLERCRVHATIVSAHPGYPDREGFGRRRLEMTPRELQTSVASQCDALADIAASLGIELRHVKAHGALYHAITTDPSIADAFVRGVVESLGHDITFVAPAVGVHRSAMGRTGARLLREGFADRGVRPDGSLIPRGETGDVLTSEADVRARAAALCTKAEVDTICVHGDTPGSVRLARVVRRVCEGS